MLISILFFPHLEHFSLPSRSLTLVPQPYLAAISVGSIPLTLPHDLHHTQTIHLSLGRSQSLSIVVSPIGRVILGRDCMVVQSSLRLAENSYPRQTMNFRKRTVREIAEMICGNFDQEVTKFQYRTSTGLTQFFGDCDTDFTHDGSTRSAWVESVLWKILKDEPQPNPPFPPDTFLRVIQELMTPEDAINESSDRKEALAQLNLPLRQEGFEAYYAEDGKCYLRHVPSAAVSKGFANPHRPFTREEMERRGLLNQYLDVCSEDDLIEQVLLPLFRHLNFQRVSAAGHVDKALEYGKDVWMRYRLPTQHYLYFGLQAKIGKIDSAGQSARGSANVAELLNQITMMLGHEIFDPETNKKHLPDHAFIVAGGTITKAARNWLGNMLDLTKRSQIIFMDRDDILNLFITSNIPLPDGAQPIEKSAIQAIFDDIPF